MRGDMSVVHSKLAAPAYKTKGDDRRRGERKPYVCDAFVFSPTATSDDEKIEVSGINLSRHGVAFEVADALSVGSFMKIELDMGAQRMVSEIRIIRCEKLVDTYAVGGEFC